MLSQSATAKKVKDQLHWSLNNLEVNIHQVVPIVDKTTINND